MQDSEAVVQRYCVKEVFLEISLNSRENTCARFSFLIKLQGLNISFYRTSLVAASKDLRIYIKGYLRYKTFFCHKVALDVKLINFFI